MAERGALPLPLRIAEIDADWLTAALRTRAPDALVEGCEIVDVVNGTCTKIRLSLRLNEAAQRAGIPELVMLKGGFESHSRAMCHMHELEALGYRDVLPVLGLPSPRCYFADYDAQRRQGIVIMEDLMRRRVEFCDPLQPQHPEQVASQLEALAKYHAQTWNSTVFTPQGAWHWITDTMSVVDHHFEPILKGDRWRRYLALPRAAAASVRYRDPAWLLDAMDRLKRLSKRRPQCVLHGDTHLGNIYYEGPGKPGFFDSLPHYGPAMWEVTYHIVCALDPIDRRRWEQSLVARYLEQLGQAGATPPDISEAMADYAVWLARAYLVFVANDPAFQSEPVNTAYVARIGAAMLDHDTLGAIERLS